MKKKFLLFFVMLTIAVSAASAAKTPKKKINDGGFYNEDKNCYSFDKELTPENSVLIYFETHITNEYPVYSQINPSKSPMIFHVGTFSLFDVDKSVVFPLVEPGSYLKVIGGFSKANNVIFNYSCSALNYSYYTDIQVPDKPGMYFLGIVNHGIDYSSFENLKKYFNGSIPFGLPKTEEDYNKLMKKSELSALKTALEMYKDTAWAPLINKRIEELSK